MAKQAAHDFIDKASKDSAVGDEVKKDPKKVCDVGKKHGHDFTQDEFNEAMSEKWGKGDQPAWYCNTDCG